MRNFILFLALAVVSIFLIVKLSPVIQRQQEEAEAEAEAKQKAYWKKRWQQRENAARGCKKLCAAGDMIVAYYEEQPYGSPECRCTMPGANVNINNKNGGDNFAPGVVTGYVVGKITK